MNLKMMMMLKMNDDGADDDHFYFEEARICETSSDDWFDVSMKTK